MGVANSWNPYWGEKGYLRIKRGNNEGGIEDQVTGASSSSTWSRKSATMSFVVLVVESSRCHRHIEAPEGRPAALLSAGGQVQELTPLVSRSFFSRRGQGQGLRLGCCHALCLRERHSTCVRSCRFPSFVWCARPLRFAAL